MRPLLGLSMIVRNEERGIATTLRSCLLAVDCYAILDTGSTDRTCDLIHSELEDIQGVVDHGDFVNFSNARNRALDLFNLWPPEDRPLFVLLLDADDQLRGGAELRRYLEAWRQAAEKGSGLHDGAGAGAHMVRMIWQCSEPQEFDSPRLARLDARWRYRGAAHELLTSPDGALAGPRLPGVGIYQDRSAITPEACAKRWRVDAQVLAAELEGDPTNNRALFYLAQSHDCLGQFDQAAALYRRRIASFGWHEERYESAYRLAGIYRHQGDASRALVTYLEAWSLSPHRAEPLAALAAMHLDTRPRMPASDALALLYARAAAALPYPAQDRLFVLHPIYRGEAHRLHALAAQALGLHPEANKALEAYAKATGREVRSVEPWRPAVT